MESQRISEFAIQIHNLFMGVAMAYIHEFYVHSCYAGCPCHSLPPSLQHSLQGPEVRQCPYLVTECGRAYQRKTC